jgi:hypothetical protein
MNMFNSLFVSGFITGELVATVAIVIFIAWLCFVVDTPTVNGKFTEFEGE